jgi:hypothetical protein
METNFDNEKYEYCLSVFGAMFNCPEIVGAGLVAGKHYFETISQLWYFFAELKILEHKFKTPALEYEVREGRAVRYHTVVKLIYLHNYVTYQVDYKFDFLRNHKIVKDYFERAPIGLTCDCSRAALIRTVVPEFPDLAHGHTIELLSCKMEDKK